MTMPRSAHGPLPKPTPLCGPRKGWVGCEDRIGWLLRMNRVYGEDERLAVGVHFARAFRGGCAPRAVDGPQITRWERASQRADRLVVRRYEQLLGLPESSLVAVADAVYREARGVPGLSFPDARAPDPARLRERTYQLLDQATGTDLMSGNDWAELTANLSVLPTLLLYPPRLWASLAERLLAEMIVACATGY